LVVIPSALADAFEGYCRGNAIACPLLERLAQGDAKSRVLAPGSDVRYDLPQYRILRVGGSVDYCDDLGDEWEEGDIAFLLGCSFSLELALLSEGLPVRHVEERKNVPMYITTIQTSPSGPFQGPLVVSMRPLRRDLFQRACQVTKDLWYGHGAPLQMGVEGLGIVDVARPDFGDAVTIREDEVPVFWACGVTSQVAAAHALKTGALHRLLAHSPGAMFITDLTGDKLLERLKVV